MAIIRPEACDFRFFREKKTTIWQEKDQLFGEKITIIWQRGPKMAILLGKLGGLVALSPTLISSQNGH